ncbi:MAG: hypothetical protein ACRDZ4_13145 [Egibacteraceae bacterium]
MNRRGFLKFLASIPLVRHVPLPARWAYGSGNDGDVVLTDRWISPFRATRALGGGGGAGAGGLIIVVTGKITTTDHRGVVTHADFGAPGDKSTGEQAP